MGLTPETAIRLIRRYGQAAEILRQGPPVSDGGGGSTPGPVAPYPARVFVASYDVSDVQSGSGIIEADDRKVLVSIEGLTTTPEPGDVLRIDGAEPRVIRVSPVAPDGVVLFWSVQTR